MTGTPIAALFAFLIMSGCALDYNELAPFPCPADGRCPTGFSCMPGVGCMPTVEAAPECLALESLDTLRSCGTTNFTVTCANSSLCPTDSYCVGANQCACNPGFVAVKCDGSLCSGGCSYPNWWCIPKSVSAACTTASGWGPQIMHCADGRATPIDCATPASCETWCANQGAGCDTVTQNCRSAATPKCNLIVDTSGNGATGCVATRGQLAAGAACHRTGNGDDGLDDCSSGNICTAFGAASGTRVCRQFCRRDNQCSQGFHCLALSDLTPQDGVCLPDCQLYSACPSQMTCTPMLSLERAVVGYCRAVGSGARDAACQDDTDCANDLSCETGGATATCTAVCDSGHACSSGTCTPLHNTTLTSGAGLCQ